MPPSAYKIRHSLYRNLFLTILIPGMLFLSSNAQAQVPEEVRTKLRAAASADSHSAELNLGFNFRYPPDAQYLKEIKETIQTTSELLCDATEGQLLINQVRLTEGVIEEDVADVFIYPQDGRSGVSIGRQGNLAGGPQINFYRENNPANAPIVLLHELGHFLFGLHEQYSEQRRHGAACGIGEGFDPGMLSEVNNSIMQQPSEKRCVTEDSSTGYFEISGGPCGSCPDLQFCDTSIHRCREVDTSGHFVGSGGNICGTCASNEICERRGGMQCIIPDSNESDGYKLFGNNCSSDSNCTVSGAKCQVMIATEFSTNINHDPMRASGQMCLAPIPTSRIILSGDLDFNAIPEMRDSESATFLPLNYAIAEWTSTYASNRNQSGLNPARGCLNGPCAEVIDALGFVENVWGTSPSVHWVTTYFKRIDGPIPSLLNGDEICSDGIDNDGDSQVDCADNDCDESLQCTASVWQVHLGMASQETKEWSSIYNEMCNIHVNVAIRKAINGTYTVNLNQQNFTISASQTESKSSIAQRLANKINAETNYGVLSTGPYILIASHTIGENQLNSFVNASDPTAIEHKRACEGDLKILNTFTLTFLNKELIKIDGQPPSAYSDFIIPVTDLLTDTPDMHIELHMDMIEEDVSSRIKNQTNGQGICTKPHTCEAGDWSASQCQPDHIYCQSMLNVTTQRYETSAQTDFQQKSDWETILSNQYFENLLEGFLISPHAVAPAHCSRPVNIVENVESTDQVMIVLDRSGSMSYEYQEESRLDFARAAIRVFLRVYQHETDPLKVGVVQFNEQAQQIWPVNSQTLQALTPNSFLDIDTALNNIQAGGQTSIGDALLATRPAFESLNHGPRTILLVSDGYNNQTPDPVAVAANLREDLGVRVFSVAATQQADEEAMSDLAGQSDGAVFNSEKPSELLPAYFEMAAKIRGYGLLVEPTLFSLRGLKVPQSPYPQSRFFEILVEPNAQALRFLLSADMKTGDWGLDFELIAPTGQTILNQFDSRVQREGEFALVKLQDPEPGLWQLKIEAAKAKDQHSYFAAYIENSKPDCFVDSVYLPNPDRLRITVAPTWVHPLAPEAIQSPQSFEVQITKPDSSIITLGTSWDSLGGTHSVDFNDLSVRGRYQVAAKCDIASGTPIREGESIFEGSDLNLISPGFVRMGSDSYFWDSKNFYCPGTKGDCDGDGIPDITEAGFNKYRDGDDLPNWADFDSDNDDIPDSIEGAGDCDGDGVPNFVDLDSDNDGLPDGQDGCPCKPSKLNEQCSNL